jgi:hypothetical protein
MKILPEFIKRFGVPNKAVQGVSALLHNPFFQTLTISKKIQRWYFNNGVKKAASNVKARSRSKSRGRAPSVRDMVAEDHNEYLRGKVSEARAENGGTTVQNNLPAWNYHLTEVCNKLTPEELAEYEARKDAFIQQQNAPLSRDETFEQVVFPPFLLRRSLYHRRQRKLAENAASKVRNLLGWEHGQFGDAACFLAIAYRDSSNTVEVER